MKKLILFLSLLLSLNTRAATAPVLLGGNTNDQVLFVFFLSNGMTNADRIIAGLNTNGTLKFNTNLIAYGFLPVGQTNWIFTGATNSAWLASLGLTNTPFTAATNWGNTLHLDLNATGHSITNANIVKATSFIGDGSGLTGISGGGGSFIPLTDGVGNGTSITNAHDTVILGKPTPPSTGTDDAPPAVGVIIQGAHGGNTESGLPSVGGPLLLLSGAAGSNTNGTTGLPGDVVLGDPNLVAGFIQIDQFDQQLGIYNMDIQFSSGRGISDSAYIQTGTIYLDAGEGELHPDTGQLGFNGLTYTADGSGSNATWTVNGGTNTALQLSSTTSFITFSQTNSAPLSTNIVCWVAFSLAGDTNKYRVGLCK